MSTAPVVDRAPDTTERREITWLWWAVLIVVLAGAGVALWLLLPGDTQATISYDGTTAVYSGPSQLEAYPDLQTFQLVNDSDNSIDFAYGAVQADALEEITEEEARAWGLTHTDPPPWVGEGNHLAMYVTSGETLEADAAFIAGRTYEFVVWDRAQERAHWVAWIEATE